MAWAAIAERPEVMRQLVLLGASTHFLDFYYSENPDDFRCALLTIGRCHVHLISHVTTYPEPTTLVYVTLI